MESSTIENYIPCIFKECEYYKIYITLKLHILDSFVDLNNIQDHLHLTFIILNNNQNSFEIGKSCLLEENELYYTNILKTLAFVDLEKKIED